MHIIELLLPLYVMVFTVSHPPLHRQLDVPTYHRVADETLEELSEFFEVLGDSSNCPADYDVSLAVRDR